MCKKLPLLFAFLLIIFCAQGQTLEPDEHALENRIENAVASSETERDYSSLLDDADALRESPINLNTATRVNLERSGLFSDSQINALLDHIARHGKLMSVYELQAVESFDLGFIRFILPYITTAEAGGLNAQLIRNAIHQGKHQILLRTLQAVEKGKGYEITDPNKNRYLGSPLRAYARYRFNYKNKILAGFTAEKDAGEQFFKGAEKQGFDYYSAHVIIHSTGHLRTLALGDYQLQYGQGLVMWSGLAFGKTPDVINIRKYAVGIRPHNAVDENAALRGSAISLAVGNFHVDLFCSYKEVDANVSVMDTLSDKVLQVSSIQTSGYHRTPSELADKHAIQQTVMGSHLAYNSKRLGLGFTYTQLKLSAPLVKNSSVYNQYEFSGTNNSNMGLDYNYQYKNLSLFGEVAHSNNGGIAFVNGALLALDERLSFSVLHRSYGRDYQAFYGNGFGENSNTTNESGLYWGVQLKASSTVTLSAYYDLYSFPWRKYLVTAPSHGYEALLQATYKPSKRVEFYVRARFKEKGQNAGGNETALDYVAQVNTRNIRLNASYQISPAFSFNNRLELVSYKAENGAVDEGFMVFQDVIYKPMGSRIKAAMRYALFATDSYNSRIYAYESDVLYYFYTPAYYYHGNRAYVLLQYRIAKGVDLWLRYGTTVYSNKKTVGSGLDEVAGNVKSEIKAQLRIEF